MYSITSTIYVCKSYTHSTHIGIHVHSILCATFFIICFVLVSVGSSGFQTTTGFITQHRNPAQVPGQCFSKNSVSIVFLKNALMEV